LIPALAFGSDPRTSKSAFGWRDRLQRFESEDTGGVTAWCLEAHDPWISKAIADRKKDVELCRALLTAGIVERSRLSLARTRPRVPGGRMGLSLH
jgi:hypothetical protein